MEYLHQGLNLLFKAGILGFGWQMIRGMIGMTKRLDCMRESLTSCQLEVLKVRDFSSMSHREVMTMVTELRQNIDELKISREASVKGAADAMTKMQDLMQPIAESYRSLPALVASMSDKQDRLLAWNVELKAATEKLLGKIIRNRRKPGPKKKLVIGKEGETT